jgi:hypothetical protein
MNRTLWLLLFVLILLYGVAGDMEYRDRLAMDDADVQRAEVVARW